MKNYFCVAFIDFFSKLSVNQLLRQPESFGVHFFGQVERDHGGSCIQSTLDLLKGFQVVPVRSITFLIIFLEDRPSSIPDRVGEISPRRLIFFDGLLCQDRMSVKLSDGPNMSWGG